MKQVDEHTEALLSEISNLYMAAQQAENERIMQGDTFNVFNTINLRSDEVRLHSAFIAELLNPNGKHGASSHFLEAFLKLIGVDDDFINFNKCSLNIVERVIGPVTETEGGRIDIIIEDGNHAIIFENKIYAGDQKNQMLRYYNYGRKHFSKGFRLIYLTLDGHEPSACSLGQEDYEYISISYENEIISWLEECFNIADEKPLVQSVIKQYCELIKQLTYKDVDMQYIEKLKSITLAPENVLAVGEILKIQDEWMDCIYEQYIWNPLKDFAISKGMDFGIDCTYGEGGAWIYRHDWKHYALFIWTERKSDWQNMQIGISWYNEPNKKTRIYKKDFFKLNCLENEPSYDWPYGWEYLREEICHWNCHITEKIVKGEVCDYIIKKFEEILLEIEEHKLNMP